MATDDNGQTLQFASANKGFKNALEAQPLSEALVAFRSRREEHQMTRVLLGIKHLFSVWEAICSTFIPPLQSWVAVLYSRFRTVDTPMNVFRLF